MDEDKRTLDTASTTLLVLFFASAAFTTFYFTNDNPKRWLMLAFTVTFLVLCFWSFYKPLIPLTIALLIYALFIAYGYSDHGEVLIQEIGSYLYLGFWATAAGALVAYKRKFES